MHDDSLVKCTLVFHHMNYSNIFLIFWDQLLTAVTTGELQIYSIHSYQKKLNPFTVYFDSDEAKTKLTEEDLAFRFAIFPPTVSRYFITWIYFMYTTLKI